MKAPEVSDDVPVEDYRRFIALVEHHTGLDLGDAEPGSLLREDLGFDSLAMAEVLVLLADHGIVLPEDLIAELRTLADLAHYATIAACADPARTEPVGPRT